MEYELEISSVTLDELVVVSATGTEAMSDLPRFDVIATCRTGDAGEIGASLRRPASLTLRDPRGDRAFRGIVTRTAVRGLLEGDRTLFDLRIEPRLALLQLRRNTRIFQQLSVPEVVEMILGEHGVAFRRRLAGSYAKREYCVQYRETDYRFIVRLLAEEGIWFYVDHPLVVSAGIDVTGSGDSEVVVLSDTAQYYPPISGARELAYRPMQASSALTSDANQVLELSVAAQVLERGVLIKRYDFQRPRLDLRGVANEGAQPVPSPAIESQLFYEHHHDYEEGDHDGQDARVLYEQLRRDAVLATGRSLCPRLAPGHVFDLHGHELSPVDQSYVVTRVTHHARTAANVGPDQPLYWNEFECVPASVPYRPSVPSRRMLQALETATVVGPEPDGIYTDELGRIKVQFHWDRDGKHDGRSSCWIRVAHAWAGAGWGTQFIPRAGMEVLVSFAAGDPDRPIVVACLYNGDHHPPFPVPEHKTRSGIRTASQPGGGFNELSFEDAKDAEEIYLHAQRNLRELVQRDHELTVRNDRTIHVDGAQLNFVGKDTSLQVGGDHTTSVAGEALHTVDGDCRREIGESVSEVCRGHAHYRSGSRFDHVERDAQRFVGRSLQVTVGEVGHDAFAQFDVLGMYGVFARETLTLRSHEAIELNVGSSSIRMTGDAVDIRAKQLRFVAEESLVAKGGGAELGLSGGAQLLGGTVKLASSGASVVLDANASVDGALVRLNCGAPGAAGALIADPSLQLKPLRLAVGGYDKQPLVSARYELIAGGVRYEGATTPDGRISEQIPADAKAAHLTVWLGEYPAGERLHWSITIAELPSIDTVEGVKTRLRNLGYYRGAIDEEESEELRRGLRDFQEHRGLKVTGERDAATMALLAELQP